MTILGSNYERFFHSCVRMSLRNISYYVHTQMGDSSVETTIEFSDAMMVTITVYDDYMSELVTEVVNVTFAYDGATYSALTSSGASSVTLPDTDAAGAVVTTPSARFPSYRSRRV